MNDINKDIKKLYVGIESEIDIYEDTYTDDESIVFLEYTNFFLGTNNITCKIYRDIENNRTIYLLKDGTVYCKNKDEENHIHEINNLEPVVDILNKYHDIAINYPKKYGDFYKLWENAMEIIYKPSLSKNDITELIGIIKLIYFLANGDIDLLKQIEEEEVQNVRSRFYLINGGLK